MALSQLYLLEGVAGLHPKPLPLSYDLFLTHQAYGASRAGTEPKKKSSAARATPLIRTSYQPDQYLRAACGTACGQYGGRHRSTGRIDDVVTFSILNQRNPTGAGLNGDSQSKHEDTHRIGFHGVAISNLHRA